MQQRYIEIYKSERFKGKKQNQKWKIINFSSFRSLVESYKSKNLKNKGSATYLMNCNICNTQQAKKCSMLDQQDGLMGKP